MAFWEYTLTGFGEFFEQRRVTFAEPMPADRVCSICGRIPSNAVVLPCAHVSCLQCKVEVCAAKQCPLDGTAVTEEELVPFETDACYLERWRVVCIVDGRKCPSNFSGKLSDLRAHLTRCRGGDVHCTKCYRPVTREAAAEHYRQCCDSNSRCHSVSDAVVREAVEGIRGIKEDLESLRQKALNERDSEDELVNGVNGLVERLANLDRSLSVAQETASGAQREGSQSSQSSAPGPFRAASKPGVYITTCKFKNVYAARDSLSQTKREHGVLGDDYTLSGYTFRPWYQFSLSGDAGSEQVSVLFAIHFKDGEWDDYVEWPCSKKVALVITHPRDVTKDVRLPLRGEAYEVAKKPRPGMVNKSYRTEMVSWNDIEFRGYITKDTLYVNVELE
ncbi:uncharacterized protein LOC119406636 isoform X2 [Rhipicephalus sanguineus]|uniref:uncharacterized protein LOC119406636 isoform X2 n=1 Tax=Rhipicephalus sanguineus TaxID=34632 RepID=UPI0020C4AE8E|nr:uncharacterized protein LOC119406636 isoform X2 [Rhipicephalus sanguineus]